MSHIFYMFIIAPILWETLVVISPRKVTNFVKDLKPMSGDSITPRQKTLGNYMLLYLIWNIIGLFTGQWLFFLIILGLGFIPKNNAVLTFMNGFFSLIILIFIILNQYHFHIDFNSILFK